ncbi:MAG: transcriptional regulator [Lactobacillus sp.]|nr:transcriptional regulator [Lactobacillus sp.]
MNRLKELRKSHSLSQAELAKETGISNQAVSFYENGKRQPKIETWQKLADFYGVSVPYLQGYEQPTPHNRLKELRQQKGLSQSKLCLSLNCFLRDKEIKPITVPTWSRWENGLNSPTKSMWKNLADYFKVSVSYIKGEIDIKKYKKFCKPCYWLIALLAP